MQHLLPPAMLGGLAPALKIHLLGREFFPRLIGPPLMQGLRLAFCIAAAMSLVAAVASLLRGRQIYAALVTRPGPRKRRHSAAPPSHHPGAEFAEADEQRSNRRASHS